MKKIFLLLISILILNLFISQNVTASSNYLNNGKYFFAGQIKNKSARDIESLENSGYKCTIPGETIEIKPIRGEGTSYFIASSIKPNTKYPIRNDQKIMGLYKGTEDISCKKCEAEDQSDVVGIDLGISKDKISCKSVNISLPRIILFGTSRI